jgi:hypothetical protein
MGLKLIGALPMDNLHDLAKYFQPMLRAKIGYHKNYDRVACLHCGTRCSFKKSR